MKFKYQPITKQQVEDRLDDLNSPGKKKNIFKAKEQAQTVRIIPYIHNDNGNPFIEKNFHYNLDGGTVLCPSTIGDDCPICRFASQLWQKGEKDMAKKFFKSDRIYVPVIQRNGTDKTPKFWGVSRTNYQEILNTIADPDYGDVIHPLEGRDLTVTKIPEGQYGKVAIKFKPKTSPIAETEKEIEQILASCTNFDDIYPLKSQEELEAILDKTINSQANARKKQGGEAKSDAGDKAAGSKGYMDEVNNALGDK